MRELYISKRQKKIRRNAGFWGLDKKYRAGRRVAGNSHRNPGNCGVPGQFKMVEGKGICLPSCNEIGVGLGF